MFALIDIDSAYCAFESVFDPSIRGKPIIVCSNNDGAVIARSKEAKALGIGMAQPVHEIPPEVRKQLVIRSANFELYGSMSDRFYRIVQEAAPRVERYSVDEQFFLADGIRDRRAFALQLVERVKRYLGTNSCCGLGPSKTLAKAGNKLAKSGAVVVDLSDPSTHDEALARLEVGDVWGVGRRWAPRLQAMGIRTARDLRDAPPDQIGETFGVVLLRTQRELQGRPCAGIESEDPDRKSIMVSRSFGERVTDLDQVHEAVATFASRACEKARKGGLVAGAMQVHLATDVFRPDQRQHHPSCSFTFPVATSDTRLVLALARRMVEGIAKPGYAYKKAGVMLFDLARPDALQADLFSPPTVGDEILMSTLDSINKRFGRSTVKFAAAHARHDAPWRMRQRNLSPCYTTRLSDLPRVNC